MKYCLAVLLSLAPGAASAQYLDGLPVASSLAPANIFPVCQGGTAGRPGTCTTKQATIAQLQSSITQQINLRANCGAVGNGVADDSLALKTCINLVNASYASHVPVVLYAPAGIYLIKSANGTMPAFAPHVPGKISGDGQHKTYFTLDSSYVGDLFAWSEAWTATNNIASPYVPASDRTGAEAIGFTIGGNTASAAQQNALHFYDRNDFVLVKDVDVFYLNGACLSIGQTLNLPEAYMRESVVSNLRCFNTGRAAVPAVLISSTTELNSDATNELNFYALSVDAAAGPGVVISNPNGFSATRLIRFYGLRSEGSSGDGVDIGLSTDAGQVRDIDVFDLHASGIPSGKFGLKISSNQSFLPLGIAVRGGTVGSGADAGGGLDIDASLGVFIDLDGLAVAGPGITLGQNAQGVHLAGSAASTGISYSSSTDNYPLQLTSQYSVYGRPSSAYKVGAAALQATATGATAVRLTMDGATATPQNCFAGGPTVSSGYNMSIQLMAQDVTTPTKYYGWTQPIAALVTSFGGTAIDLSQVGTPVVVSHGTLTGVATSLTADGTNICPNLSWTPPTGNTDTWNVTALITFARAP